MQSLSRSQLVLLVLLTLAWGLNWPVMKLGVTGYPPLTFRTISIWLGVPVLGAALVLMKVPFRIPRAHWRELLVLSATNMFVWHGCIILAVKNLSSGRSAILAYTMPIFSAIFGALLYKAGLTRRSWIGVIAASTGVVLLLWHEITGLAGNPGYVGLALIAAASWALGTQQLRRTRIEVPTLTISFWMTTLTALVMTTLSLLFEPWPWVAPNTAVGWAIVYNGVMIFGFAHAAWFTLARGLPPMASSLSVMFIPVLGVFGGAIALREVLHWQDWSAVGLMVVAIGSVLWPARRAG